MPLFSPVLASIQKKLVSISVIISMVVFGKPDMKINRILFKMKNQISDFSKIKFPLKETHFMY